MRLGTVGGWLALAALGLSGCGGSNSGGNPATPTQAAAVSNGPGATDAVACDVPYGDPPAQVSPLDSLSGDAERILSLLLNQCWEEGGETLHWTDAQSEARSACLFTPANAGKTAQLPLVVYLQGSLFPAAPQVIYNDWIKLYKTADLNGDASRPGFILLVPIGRNTHHFYPFPDTYNLGWDNWYRNLDRGSPGLNLDVAAIDQFIEQVEGRGVVDSNRVYVTGWSNGAAMAQLYALNTPSIAASAVYSSPDPFRDVQDPCAQTPFATTMTPLMDIHNSCDVIGICQTGTQFHQDLAGLFPTLVQDPVIVDSNKKQVQACNAACASQTIAGDPAGLLNHMLWPSPWDSAMFAWLREHPLDAKQ